METHPALRLGRLTRTVHSRRSGRLHDLEPTLRIEHREALMYALSKAAELEHLIICQYLYAAFSLKRDAGEGLSPEMVRVVGGWHHQLMEIAEQEMLHLALVQNLLSAVGAGPHFARPNFPVPPRAFPARLRIELLPFGDEALRHFAFLERPEGSDIADVEMFLALEKAQPLPGVTADEIGPIAADFETISHLYRSIEDGLGFLSEKMGEERLFIGPRRAQATGEHFHFPELIAVVDLATAKAAIEVIVEQGEGARGHWQKSHFGRLMAMLASFEEALAADPGLVVTRPVVPAHVRPPESGVSVALISAPFTVRVMDLLNAAYEVVLQVLARYFNHTDESDADLALLAEVAMVLMEDVVGAL
ncbi:MAG: ferritin-like domain-containing protein, partial [Chloroflexota bacterium]